MYSSFNAIKIEIMRLEYHIRSQLQTTLVAHPSLARRIRLVMVFRILSPGSSTQHSLDRHGDLGATDAIDLTFIKSVINSVPGRLPIAILDLNISA